MSKIRIGINGFGRIGRLAFRVMANRPDMVVVGINDRINSEYMKYQLKYDSVHGVFDGTIETDGDDVIIINGNRIRVTSENNPADLRWGDLDVDFVLESTGQFTSAEKSQAHIDAGAKHVVVSAPASGTPMFVMGVNHNNYKGEPIISNASCTTNCLAPLAKVVNDEFGIVEGLMTTVHSVTSSQKLVDASSHRDWRAGRSAIANIVPSTTGAAKAVGQVIPELNGKLTGMSLRVPTVNVSIVDLTCRIQKSATYEEICAAIKRASETNMKGIIRYVDEPLVSTDFLGESHTCIFDEKAGIQLNDNFVKLVAWYDNEWGYSTKIVDMIEFAAKYNDVI